MAAISIAAGSLVETGSWRSLWSGNMFQATTSLPCCPPYLSNRPVSTKSSAQPLPKRKPSNEFFAQQGSVIVGKVEEGFEATAGVSSSLHTLPFSKNLEALKSRAGFVVAKAALESRSASTPSLNSEPSLVQVKAQDLSADAFAPYGQVVGPTEDGTKFGPEDAALDVTRGIPRVYVMRLRDKPLTSFDRITHHAAVTQCLGAIGVISEPWYLAVAPPSIVEDERETDQEVERSCAGHLFVPPKVSDVKVFRISGPQVVKLHIGTWHAGPFFKPPEMDFCNLELADTNVVDHTTHVFKEKDGIIFQIVDEEENV